jgi:adenosylcobinamide-GDP ribazoletransferase
MLLAALASAVAVGWLARRKIGGISGDVLGACEQVAECACLVVVSGLAMRHTLWWS